MTELIIEWTEAGQLRSERITPTYAGKQPGTVRVGRNPQQCDIVLSDSTVSGLHVEIFYEASRQTFFLRSLRQSNPPLLNGQAVTAGPMPLSGTCRLQLGRTQLTTIAQTVGSVTPTEVVSPDAGVPPTQYQPPQRPSANLPPPPIPVSPPPTVPSDSYQTDSTWNQKGPKVWVWVIGGVLAISAAAFAWPNIQTYFGFGPISPTISSEDPAISSGSRDDGEPTEDESLEAQMEDLVTYTHPTGLFRIETPRSWRREDQSQAGRTVNVIWSDDDSGSSVEVVLTTSNRTYNEQQLGELAVEILQDAFGDRPDFTIADPDPAENSVVRVRWEFSVANGAKLLGATFARQGGDKISLASVYVLESAFEQVKPTIEKILDSYVFDPSVAIE